MVYNWSDFFTVTSNKAATYDCLGYMNRVHRTNMTPQELGTLMVIHELRNQITLKNVSDAETFVANREIHDACIN
jgi:hypothetical protein